MALPQDIQRIIQEIPHHPLAKQFADLLAAMMNDFARKAQERLVQLRATLGGQDSTLTATEQKSKRRPPFIKDPDLAVDRESKIVDLDHDEPNAKPKF
jgi:hypothetical protein